MSAPRNTPPQGESYEQKRNRVHRRQEDILTLLKARLLTYDEVKEYFELQESLRIEPAGPSEDEAEEPQEGEGYQGYRLTPDDIPAWTGARLCGNGKIELVPRPDNWNRQANIEWRKQEDPPFRLGASYFIASEHLPLAYEENFLRYPKRYSWQKELVPEHLKHQNKRARSFSRGDTRARSSSRWQPHQWSG